MRFPFSIFISTHATADNATIGAQLVDGNAASCRRGLEKEVGALEWDGLRAVGLCCNLWGIGTLSRITPRSTPLKVQENKGEEE